MLRVWNMTLVIVTFFLTIFGTFMTRSGVVQSVHAFGEDRALAAMFTGFMTVLLVVSFGLLIYRLPLLRARHELDSWVSREAAFLANNWILLFSAMFVLFATMFPTLSEAVAGERLTVGPPFFNKWMLPIGLALLLLTGIGPLLAWRKSTVDNLRFQFQWPLLAAVVVGVGLAVLGVRVWSSGVCFALSAFVMVTLVQEFVRGARVRQQYSGSDLVTSAIGLVARNQRRYGGYIVHLGIVVMALGFAGDGFKQEEQLLLKPGQSVTVGPYTVRHDAIAITQDAQKQMVTARMTAFDGETSLGTLAPAKWFYNKRTDEPTTEVAIRRSFGYDLYVVLAGFDAEQQSATFHVVVNPLVNWIWAGFGILALGTLLALLPEKALATAAVKVPAGAAGSPSTTALLVLVCLVGGAAFPRVAHAQHVEGASTVIVAMSPLERELRSQIVCMCGTCGRQRIAECTCGKAEEMRVELAGLVKQGYTREQVFDYYIQKYGSQEPLAMPLDQGFNRLAWAVPYALGLVGAVVAGGMAVRWSKQRPQSETAAPEAPTAQAETWQARLDEELRDLD